MNRSEELLNFYNNTGRLPKKRKHGVYESSLYNWYDKYLSKVRRGVSDPIIDQTLEKLPGFLEKSVEKHEVLYKRECIERAREVKKFYLQNNRLPKAGSKCPREKKLELWLRHYLYNERRGRIRVFSDSVNEIIGTIPEVMYKRYVGARPNHRSVKAYIYAQGIKHFTDAHGRLPNVKSKNLEEKKLGSQIRFFLNAWSGRGPHAYYPQAILTLACSPQWLELLEKHKLS